MEKAELVFIPSPGAGHLEPTTELAKLMVAHDDRLSVTILVMKPPYIDSKVLNSRLQSLAASTAPMATRIRFIELPAAAAAAANQLPHQGTATLITSFIESQKPHVRNAVSELITTGNPRGKLAGIVLGMFITTMIDVANEFNVPCYMYFTSNAAFLGLLLHMQALNDHHNVDTCSFRDSEDVLTVSSFSVPVPPRVLPSGFFDKEWHGLYYGNARRFKETKGILVNTFAELEPCAIRSFGSESPPLYPIGPIVKRGVEATGADQVKIIEWLDQQPQGSVVFLCFGSMGSFEPAQVKEIALALERSGFRFLWSQRVAPPNSKTLFPTEYLKLEEVLPEGFLERTAGVGMVTGWVPQVAILAHEAVGAFVSHCGWNSTLESLWFGVPIATWPLNAEQQLNAFHMVEELELAVEVKMDYRREDGVVVGAEEIEKGIRAAMEKGNGVRKRVKEMSEISRRAISSGGSSYFALDRFLQELALHNL